MPGKREYHVIKQEIIRILDTGLLGKGDTHDNKAGAMEIDACHVDPAYGEFAEAYMNGDLNAMYGKGGKGGKGGEGGKVGKGNFQWPAPWGKGGAPGKGGKEDGAKVSVGKRGM